MKRNRMMDWPVIDPGIREYLRHQQMELPGQLKELQEEASQRRVPVIPHETVVFLDWLFDLIQPKEVLEIGTAIGFSTLLMAERVAEGGRVTTIERNPQMIEEALANISKFNMEDRITVLEGDAAEHLQKLEGPYDFVFMDSAKAKYPEFFPDIMKLLKVGGVLAIDDVLQGGTIMYDERFIPKRVRKIHRKLNEFLDEVLTHESLKSSLLPLGDGLLMITKKEDYDFSYMKSSDTD